MMHKKKRGGQRVTQADRYTEKKRKREREMDKHVSTLH